MTYTRQAKRSRNVSADPAATSIPLCCLCQPAEPEGAYHQTHAPTKAKANDCGYLPQTMSGCSTVTAETAATNASASSVHSSQITSTLEKELCPVTGVYADVSAEYFILPAILGKGHYGVVRECVHRATRQSFAVKSVDKSKIGRLDHLQREIFLLANVDHRNIMRMVDCYEDADYVHIISEKYDGGELFDKIIDETNSHGCFSERRAGAVIKSLLEAVAYLHDNGVVHRDIKPENVLFESKREDAAVRLIDFGLSRRHGKGDRPMSNPVGTAYYMSPELLHGEYDASTDLWSVGVVAYVLLCGFPPFNGGSDCEIQESTRRNPLHFRTQGWSNKSDDAMDFVRCLLRKDPRERFTAREALAHPWIKNVMAF